MPYISSNAVRQISDGSNQGTVLGRSAADPIAFYGGIPRTQASGATSAVPITASTLALSAVQAGSTAGVGFSTAALFNAFLSTVTFLQADVQALTTNLNALTQATLGLGLTAANDGSLNVKALSPIAWFRYGVGISTATGVSQWADQSGNGNHLAQATGANQPTLNPDKSILFDGVAHVLKCTNFTLNQPETVYILAKPVSWTNTDYIFGGSAVNTMELQQATSTPNIRQAAGSATGLNGGFAVGAYAVVAVVFNGASSLIQVNTNAATTGDAGAANAGGFTLGALGGGATNFGNIEVKEVIIFPVAHDAATRNRVIRYLGFVGGVSV